MIVTELYKGQGLGNQLFCYVTTRTIAEDNGYSFGIKGKENFKGLDFLNLDFGKPVTDGSGPEGGPPLKLPNEISYYYNEQSIIGPGKADVRTYDSNLPSVSDNTKIDGIMQDERYFSHKKEAIQKWLQIKEEYNDTSFARDDICIINFRGGEYVGLKDVFLTKKYWNTAISKMKNIRSDMQFIVVTDDIKTAKQFFPKFEVRHKSIANDYALILNAHYLILSNSSFAWFPAWLNTNAKLILAPKYWARHNVSNGYWSTTGNLTNGWIYINREGNEFDYQACKKELEHYIDTHPETYINPRIETLLVISQYYNDLSWVPEYTDNYLIYDQSDEKIYPPRLDENKVIQSPHLGHNIRDYCTYIIDHYDNLPEQVAFLTGNVFPRHIHKDTFNKHIVKKQLTPFVDPEKHKTKWPVSFIKNGLYYELNTSWYIGPHKTKYFNSYNDFLRFCFVNPKLPYYIPFTPGANYIVPREYILKLPKIFYENLRTFVSHNPDGIPGESHIIERALYALWTEDWEINKHMLTPISEIKKRKHKRPLLLKIAHRILEYTSHIIFFSKRVARKLKRMV